MPNPNALVSTVVRFEPPLERISADELRRVGGVSVVFEGDRRLRLDPAEPRATGLARVLDGLSKVRTPAYVEFDPATSNITRLLIPHVTRVLAIQPAEGGLSAQIAFSHGTHLLPRESTDFTELETLLRDAMRTSQLVVVTETDDHQIIDVRPYTPGPGGPPSPFPEVPPPGPVKALPVTWGCGLWGWLCAIFPWFCCISLARAQQAFNAMAATTCDPLTVPPPCIPFLYPDDGCWARAHEMCRLMISMGLNPRKVWIQGSLHVNTRNNPRCYVNWGWHVAPTLCVRTGWFQTTDMVIDPSLFTMPVDEPTWKGVQGDPSATLTPTDASIYWLWGYGTDPNYSQTNYYLNVYRLRLQNRAVQYGPPPYANCP